MKRSRNVDLLEELIREILLRLPVKALLRCKCVCKQWCALIGSRSFIDDHFSHESNEYCVLIQHFSSSSRQREIEFAMYTDDGRHSRNDDAFNYLSKMPFGDNMYLLGPANGVFCLVVDTKLGRVALLNPATRKFKPLPPIPLPKLMNGIQFVFGFDSLSGDFKVIAFLPQRKSRNFFCVYSSNSDSWSKTEVVDWLNGRKCIITTGVHRDVFVNGIFHWVDILGCKSILGFDMRSENFHEIPAPESIRDAKLVVDIIAYGDLIALFSREVEGERCVDLWTMGTDGLWTQSLSISTDLPLRNMTPLCVWNKNELLLKAEKITEIEAQEPASVLFLFDISTQKLRKFGPEFHVTSYKLYSYKESLASIEGETDIGDFVHHFFT